MPRENLVELVDKINLGSDSIERLSLINKMNKIMKNQPMMRISTPNKIGMEGFYLGLKLTIKEVVEDTIMIAEEEDVAEEVVKPAP